MMCNFRVINYSCMLFICMLCCLVLIADEVSGEMTLEHFKDINSRRTKGTEPCVHNGVLCTRGEQYCSDISRNCEPLFGSGDDEETKLKKCCQVLNGTVDNIDLYDGCMTLYGQRNWENNCRGLGQRNATTEEITRECNDEYLNPLSIGLVCVGAFLFIVVILLIIECLRLRRKLNKPTSSDYEKEQPAKEKDCKISDSKKLEREDASPFLPEESPVLRDAEDYTNSDGEDVDLPENEERTHPADEEARKHRTFHNNNQHLEECPSKFVPSGTKYSHDSNETSV